MKKLLSLMLALCLLLALCACGAPAEETAEAAPAEEAASAAAEAPAQSGDASGEPSGEPSDEPSAEPATNEAGGTGAIPEAPVAAADQPVPEHAEPIALELDPDASYLAFAADQHGELPGFRVWVEDQVAVYGDQLDLLSYSGDICEKNWDAAMFDSFKALLDEVVPGRYNVTTGNQEWKSGAPGATWDELGEGFTYTGEVAKTDTYIVYDIGACSEQYIFAQEQIDAISEYLAAAPNNIPIFVVSHFPLHLACATASHGIPASDHRQTENNGALMDVLNNYPNVVFLWAHNHTFQEPRYGVISPAGSKFTWDYNNPTDKYEINFNYVNIGSFCRGDSYGMIAEVLPTDAGVQVIFNYVDTNVPMETKDSAVMTFAPDGTVTVDSLTAGSGIDYNEILSMSGFDTDPAFMDELRAGY